MIPSEITRFRFRHVPSGQETTGIALLKSIRYLTGALLERAAQLFTDGLDKGLYVVAKEMHTTGKDLK